MFIDFRLGLGHSVHRLVTNLEPQRKTRPDRVSYFARMLKASVILNQVVCNFFHPPQNRASSGTPPYDYLLRDVWKAGELRNDAKQEKLLKHRPVCGINVD